MSPNEFTPTSPWECFLCLQASRKRGLSRFWGKLCHGSFFLSVILTNQAALAGLSITSYIFLTARCFLSIGKTDANETFGWRTHYVLVMRQDAQSRCDQPQGHKCLRLIPQQTAPLFVQKQTFMPRKPGLDGYRKGVVEQQIPLPVFLRDGFRKFTNQTFSSKPEMAVQSRFTAIMVVAGSVPCKGFNPAMAILGVRLLY